MNVIKQIFDEAAGRYEFSTPFQRCKTACKTDQESGGNSVHSDRPRLCHTPPFWRESSWSALLMSLLPAVLRHDDVQKVDEERLDV